MRNQTSFRLTTTLLPTDLTAKTTQVINKVDSDGNKFYPTFTEETVVITNDDRTIMETTKATCTAGVLTFTKRGLSDDDSETQVANRKLTWNPGSLCFITAGASDLLDKDDDIVWGGKQTYTDDMESRGKATYKGRLITEKGVEYPHFDSLEDLQDYASPFGGMFAVVDSDGELYRYNAVDETWSVVTTSTPAQPAQASDVAIGTVRVATDAEFAASTDQGSNNEFLMAKVSQIKANIPSSDLHVTYVGTQSDNISYGQSKSISYTVPHAGFLTVYYYTYFDSSLNVNANMVAPSGTATPVLMNGVYPKVDCTQYRTYAVGEGTATFTGEWRNDTTVTGQYFRIEIENYIYFG